MIHKLDDIKLFCSECGGVDDNGEFTLRKEVCFVENVMMLHRFFPHQQDKIKSNLNFFILLPKEFWILIDL